MRTATVSLKELNSCWSALQYTNNCHLCEKIATCKVKSKYRKEGLKKYYEEKENKLIKEFNERMNKLKEEREEKSW
jgi:adenosine deaminase